jgi:hypothetical protein
MKDLFETPELIPSEVQLILESFNEDECANDYLDLQRLTNELEEIGYTLDYGLDAEPFGLRPIGIKLEELEGFEN